MALPAGTTLLLAAFAWSSGRRYRARRRAHQLAWTLALLSGFVGGLAYVLCVLAGNDPVLFRLYYVGGALWIAPLLGLGSVYLLPRPLWARLFLAVTVLGGLIGTAAIATVPLDMPALARLGTGPGTGVVGSNPSVLVPVAALNTLGAAAVVGVALWSAWRGHRRDAEPAFVTGNVLIAAGTLVVGIAGAMARLDPGAGFWGTMLAGWVVLYGGVRVVGRIPGPAAARAPA